MASRGSSPTIAVTHVLWVTDGLGGHPPSWRWTDRSQFNPRSRLCGSLSPADCASNANTVGSVHELPPFRYGQPPSWFCRLRMDVASISFHGGASHLSGG